VAETDLVTEKDITKILGGVILDDGRTLLEWWKNGNGMGVKPSISFNDRVKLFNNRVAYLANNDYEKLVTYLYPKLGPRWITEGKIQMDMYMFMARHPYARRQLHYYLREDDVKFVRDTWGVWT